MPTDIQDLIDYESRYSNVREKFKLNISYLCYTKAMHDENVRVIQETDAKSHVITQAFEYFEGLVKLIGDDTNQMERQGELRNYMICSGYGLTRVLKQKAAFCYNKFQSEYIRVVEFYIMYNKFTALSLEPTLS